MDLTGYLNDFWDYIFENEKENDIYNEFSFQHELGIYLRNTLPNDYKVQFERNVDFFFESTDDFVKKEIDIVIYKCDGKNKHSCHAIELKFPKNGRVPDSMFDFVKDIKFMEQLHSFGFDSTYCMVIVKKGDTTFFSTGSKNDGIYPYFRNKKTVHAEIYQQTGKGKKTNDEEWKPDENKNYFYINGEYKIEWTPKCNKWMTYQIKTNNANKDL